MATLTLQRTEDMREGVKKTWSEPSLLDVPEEVELEFQNKGYRLRWVRVMLKDQYDAKNVMLRQREGYQFVKMDELEGLWNDAPIFGIDRLKDIVNVGDLALMKLPTEIARDRKRQLVERTQHLNDAVTRTLYENARANRLVPVTNESRSDVRVGRRLDQES